MPQQSITKHPKKIHYFAEPLHPSPNFLVKPINMVLILGGTFQMGSPETEIDRFDRESPQHEVTIPSFFMSEYPITRVHWQTIADTTPQVDIPLESSPSRLKIEGDGTTHPVTDVNWFEAVEFCKRLSKRSGRTYRLPTEAEWEYACRAGTKTSFHCGETISTDLANYDGTKDPDGKQSSAYGKDSIGIYRQETTPVGIFPPNAFGLYDMHGNVWEWCLDHWHRDYRSAPTDGIPWFIGSGDRLESQEISTKILRGGSWLAHPDLCRSAYRGLNKPVNTDNNIGFRVVCEIPRNS